jgi:hypothetical protein
MGAVSSASACNAILGNEHGHLEALDGGIDVAVDGGGDAQSAGDALPDGPRDANAPDAQDTTDDAGPWAPTSFGTSLAMWLDGNEGLSTEICNGMRCAVIWADQSGNGNDARPPFASAAPAVHAAMYNGHGALRFDGATTSLLIDDSFSTEVSGGYAIFGVAAESSSAAHQQGDIFSKTALGIPFSGPALWVNYANTGIDGTEGRAGAQVDFYQFVASGQTHLDDGMLRLYSTTFDGTTLTARVNDGAPSQVAVTVTPGSLRAVGETSSVGGRLNTNQLFLGDIAEVILVTRTITPLEWSRTYEYLKLKYAL